MYCKNCGQQLTDDKNFCPSCGTINENSANSNQQNFSQENNQNSYAGQNYNAQFNNQQYANAQTVNDQYLGGKDKTTIAILAFFLGGFGVHNFVLGENKKGIIKIALAWTGISGILALIDFVKVLTDGYVVDPDKYF